ncbi:MAG: serine protease [Dehalococcoidia bacterium]|nr:serine protease [Dehalococcoidia bacterium]
METASNITERSLDLVIHSPGGSAEAAESVVDYLRQRFDHIRVIVPVAAMSAATMVTLAGDEIIMGQHSQLGPIDPQFIIATPEGPRSAPAKAILNQFEMAKAQCSSNSAYLAAWMPILRSYAPGLLTQCENSRDLAVKMVSGWLQKYMFGNDNDGPSKSETIAQWFANYDEFQSHGRRVGLDAATNIGLRVTPLESDSRLQDAVLSIHHAAMHTFSGTPAVKIIENHHGRAWVLQTGEVVIGPAPPPARPPGSLSPATPLPANRAERRRLERGR